MRELQQQIIAEMGVRPRIDPAAEVEARVQFLVDYLEATGTSGFVLGISGGVDSTTAGRLAQLAVERRRAQLGVTDAVALGGPVAGAVPGEAGSGAHAPAPSRENPRFTAVRLPYRVQQDEADAQAAMDFIDADEERTLNIAGGVDGLAEAFAEAAGEPLTDYNKGNVKARMRMVAQYALAGAHGQLVIGTDHGAESVTGFFTKFGDGGADVLPLFGLDKRQIRAVAEELGAPEPLWNKLPTADLLDGNPGRTDEDELGMTYEHIDDYLEGRQIPEAVAEKLEGIWLRSRHKRTTPVTIHDTWWR
ncbi:ammonia-dependent NAD(+) synthetase [Micrococcus flavus]|uniref:NH(3)-dependent NAD(+) synthetase n=1 Tax=Micrococcus flavus TaxID=384602 RepID=A0A4Y8X157_9MICC|nr:ammonia-dependent NAD(+) synthetase [Micrococcus flavus]MBB4883654.1 NAD+ synthase [Micrococcus flavus]TFI02415.1 ammonia-dependent NAD(+) synthetase [Micrococcus flavus]GGK48739.1 NH(3)-dependent NAD(+) synthetase [Micrococcus flavus]